MAEKTKIKSDQFGLFVIADCWIARPLFGTIFKEGDEVKSHHFGGSTLAGVTTHFGNFKKVKGLFEYWGATEIDIKYEKCPTQKRRKGTIVISIHIKYTIMFIRI